MVLKVDNIKVDNIKKSKNIKKGLLMIFYQKQTFCIKNYKQIQDLVHCFINNWPGIADERLAIFLMMYQMYPYCHLFLTPVSSVP